MPNLKTRYDQRPLSADKLNTWFAKDNKRFRQALEQTGNKVTATEPITGLVECFEKELDLVAVSGEPGIRPADFSQQLAQSPALSRVLGPLRVPGGTVQRQVFTESYPALVRELKLGVVSTAP